MKEYIHFVIEHWLLSSAFVIVLILFIINEVIHALRGIPRCTSQQLVQMMNHDHATVVDLRDKVDFRNGHIIEAKNIGFAELKKATAQFDKAKPLILVCTNSQQSEKAALLLRTEGFSAVYCLRGGMAGWRADSMPVAKR
jgi:rhodanese-related sulfurtransferase